MSQVTKRWTLAELHRLPDDGNKYELIHGELFVTPAPSETHETIASRLTRFLDPYVAKHELGAVYRPRAVVQFQGSETEPDLMVRAERMRTKASWKQAPVPLLIVEIVSPSTRRRDYGQKREFYGEVGISEYWIVEADQRRVTVIAAGAEPAIVTDRIFWAPVPNVEPLTIPLAEIFAGMDDTDLEIEY